MSIKGFCFTISFLSFVTKNDTVEQRIVASVPRPLVFRAEGSNPRGYGARRMCWRGSPVRPPNGWSLRGKPVERGRDLCAHEHLVGDGQSEVQEFLESAGDARAEPAAYWTLRLARELARVETVIQKGYDEFVAAVAAGRDTTEAHIRDVGAGRIYSGRDGAQVGLVDEVGGLERALDLARRATGLEPDELTVREVNPTAGGISLGRFLPGPLGALLGEETAEARPATQTAPTRTFLRLMLEHQPGPLVLLPPGDATVLESVRD